MEYKTKKPIHSTHRLLGVQSVRKTHFDIKAKVWLYPGMAGWHFITLPKKQSKEIKTRFEFIKKGWGSIPVIAKAGKTSWNTSIFPDKKSDSYLLPIKLEVRKKENIKANDAINLTIRIAV
jgi:hypothetical protein